MLKKFAVVGSALAFGAFISAPASAHTAAPVYAAPVYAEAHATVGRAVPARSAALWQQITQLERDVNRAEARKTISRKEAASLRRDVAKLKQQYRRFNANGIDRNEARALENGIAKVRHHLQVERRDDDRRAH